MRDKWPNNSWTATIGRMSRDMAPWGSLAYVVAGSTLAMARFVAWIFWEYGSWIAGVFDAGHLLAVSLVASMLAEAGHRSTPAPRWLRWVGLTVLAVGVGTVFLVDDVDGFSRRQQVLPRALALYGTIALISMSVPLAAALGTLLDRPRVRWAVLAAAVGVVIANGMVLTNDYWGVHLFVAWAALVGSGRALHSARGRPQGLRPLPVFLGTLVLVLPVVFLPPPARAQSALANSTGASFTQLFSWSLFRRDAPLLDDSGELSEWMKNRAGVPPIPPNKDVPLGESPLVILVTVDALRADVVYSGKHDAKLPTFARLRDEGLVFSQTRAPGTLTKTSLASLFMGIHFSQQYWSPMKNRNGAMAVHADDRVRFTELLKEAGVHTSNFRSVNWLRNGVVMRGFVQDEEIFYPKRRSYYAPSPPVFRRLLPRVKKNLKKQRSGFVYAHLADPHAPYDQGRVKKGSEFRRYLSEVELVDSQLARLVKVLQNAERPDSILLIISADHGEAFGEHNSRTHGTTMYDEALHVPLIFWSPMTEERVVGRARVVDDLVSVIDLGPTILDLFGVATPGHMMGQSLVPYLKGEAPELTRPIIAETRLMRALVTPGRLKLIVDTRSGRAELYDLSRDPKEMKNLIDDEELARKPLAQMRRFFDVHTLRKDGYEPPFVK